LPHNASAIIAVDSYENAPAMQVAHGFEVINMLDGALDRIVASTNLILLFLRLKPFVLNVLRLRKNKVVPSAKAANFTMNRKAIRDLASKELGLKQPTTAMQLLQPNCDKESKPWECLA
jgi:phosphoribosylglycinamide formyltransferase 2